MSARTLGFIAHILRKNANLHVLKRFSPHAAGSVRFVPETRLMNMSTSQNEPKFPPPHPTVMQRLTQIEDNLRFKGYSIIRIGIGVVIVAGCAVYILREDIRDNVAGEVSTVATRSMSDESVQQKAHELSKALLQEMLNDDTIRKNAVNFIKDIFSQPETVVAVVQLLTHVLNQPASKDKLVQTLKLVLSESLEDEQFRYTLALHLRYVLENENTKQGLVYLLQSVFDDERIKTKAKTFSQETLASELVKYEATMLGKSVVEQVVGDVHVQKKTGEGLWQAFSHSVTPRWFSKDPESDSSDGFVPSPTQGNEN